MSEEIVTRVVESSHCPHCIHDWHGLACRLRGNYCSCETSWRDPDSV